MTLAKQSEKEPKLNLESISWGGLTWVNIVGPTPREVEYLAKHYAFHHLALDDCLSRKQLPKLDEYKDYVFGISHFPVYNKETRVSTHSQLSAFIGDKFLITLHTGELKALVNMFRECQSSEEARQEYFRYGSGYLLYGLLDKSVDSYFPILDKILTLMEDVEDRVYDENIEVGRELAALRRDIITQRRIIFPMRVLFAGMEAKIKRFTEIDMTAYFGDLMDHMNKICESLDECKEVIEVFKDADFILSNYRLNRVVRILTILGSMILPFLIISSVYGMNIILPGGLEKGTPQTFIILVAIMLLLSGGMLWFFRLKRWI